MYRSSPFRSTFNTSYITALGMCEVCTEAVHSVALSARVTSQLWTCVKYLPKQSIPYSTLNTSYITGLDMCEVSTEAVHSVALWTRVTSQVWACMCEVCTEAVHSIALSQHELHHSFGHVWNMYRSSPFRSTLNTSYITALGMCEVCTEAVDSVALWTRVTSQLWACVTYVPKQSIP